MLMDTEIKFDQRNYRKHSKKNKALIRKSLEELGAGRSVVIDNENELVAGNGVYEQAQALKMPVRIVETDGSELVVVKRTDLATQDDKRKKLALADNSASDTSEFDNRLLSEDWTRDVLKEWGVTLPETIDYSGMFYKRWAVVMVAPAYADVEILKASKTCLGSRFNTIWHGNSAPKIIN